MLHVGRIFKFTFQNMVRNRWLTVSSIFMMFFVILTVDIFVIFGRSFNEALTQLEQSVDFSVFFYPDADQDKIDTLINEVSLNPLVKTIEVTTKEEALQEQLATDSAALDGLSKYNIENPFSSSIDIKVHDLGDSKSVVDLFRDNPIVFRIKDQEQTISKIDKGTQLIRDVGLFLVIILVLNSLVVVFNTVRLAIYSRRVEIEIMNLVGATHWYVRAPFIFEAFFHAFFGSIFATLVIYISFDQLSMQIFDLSELLKLPMPEFTPDVAFEFFVYQILIAGAMSMLGALFAVKNHLKKQ